MAKLSLEELKEVVSNYVVSNKIAVDDFAVTRDNTIGLLDKIGKIITLDNVFVDKLAFMDGEELSFGKTIEEYYEDLIMPTDYDEQGDNALKPYDVTHRPASYSYTLGKKVIPETIRNNDIERAVHNEGQLIDIVAQKTKRLNDSEMLFRFDCKKELLSKYADACIDAMTPSTTFATSTAYEVNTYLKDSNNVPAVVVKEIASTNTLSFAQLVANGSLIELSLVNELAIPVDTATSESFITQVKKDVETSGFATEGNSLNGNTVGAESGLALILKTGVMPVVEVEAIAGAFQSSALSLPGTIYKVDDFGKNANGVFAILMDTRGARIHNSYRAVRDQRNGRGDFTNLFLHTENTAHYSKNTFIKVYKAV